MMRIGFFAAMLAALLCTAVATACPFCSAVSLTFSEEIAGSDVAVIAKLTELPPKSKEAGALDAETGKAKFAILETLKGAKTLAGHTTFEATYFGDNPVGSMFLVMAVEPPALNWSTPIAVSERARTYLSHAMRLPKEGVGRLVFFQDYLEDREDMLSRDTYDEFAKAPYAVVKELKPQMHHQKLLGWIRDTEKVPASRRRLYLTMLAICGSQADLPMLEEMMRSPDRQTKAGLDALIASYMTLKGEHGLDLVEELFLKNKEAEYTDTYAAIMAIRFHGQEEKAVPRKRLLEALRHMLDRPQLADLIIPDLARWQDWSAIDRLVDLFKNADDESSWVRVPVINYLRACPLPEAKKRIEELAKIDPEVVKRADTLFAFGALSQATGGSRAATSTGASAKPAATTPPANPPGTAAQGAKDIAPQGAKDTAATPPAATSPATPSGTAGKSPNAVGDSSAGSSASAPSSTKTPAVPRAADATPSPRQSAKKTPADPEKVRRDDAAPSERSEAPSKPAGEPKTSETSTSKDQTSKDKTSPGRSTKAVAATRIRDLLPLSGQARRAAVPPATTAKMLAGVAGSLVVLFGLFLAILRGRQHAAT